MKKYALLTSLVTFTAFTASSSLGAILSVPGGYSSVADAVAAADSGDIISITPGEYTSGIVATIGDDSITLRGEGGRARLNADGIAISNRKAIFVITGNNITIENIEFSHAKVGDENGAGIRHEGGLLTIKNCYFHDNENGILTSNQGINGELIVENSEFNHNGLGSAGYTHNIYVGRIGKFIFRDSYSHHAHIGHNIKSRARENHILYSRIMDETTGDASYQIDLPNGGLAYIIGNSLHQGINADNSMMISYAAEGAVNPIQEIYVSGNTFVNDRHTGYGIRLSGSPTAIIRNNIFDNLTGAVQGSPTSFENNLESDNSGFADKNTFEYHLTPDSPARDAGGDPGSFRGVSLTPVREYVHALQSRERSVDGTLDIGAFEYQEPVVKCNVNTICEPGENYLNCPSDCPVELTDVPILYYMPAILSGE